VVSCGLDAYCRLPSTSQDCRQHPNGWGVWGAVSVLHYGVCATLHIAEHGHCAVSWLWGFAGGAHVVGTEANAMHPTVVHDGAIVGW